LLPSVIYLSLVPQKLAMNFLSIHNFVSDTSAILFQKCGCPGNSNNPFQYQPLQNFWLDNHSPAGNPSAWRQLAKNIEHLFIVKYGTLHLFVVVVVAIVVCCQQSLMCVCLYVAECVYLCVSVFTHQMLAVIVASGM